MAVCVMHVALMFRLLMVFTNMIVDITNSRQSRAKVSAGLSSVSGLAVAVFDLVRL